MFLPVMVEEHVLSHLVRPIASFRNVAPRGQAGVFRSPWGLSHLI